MSKREEYEFDHRWAKLIVFIIVVCLILLNNTWSNILAVGIWLFGVNPIQYMLEMIDKHSHKVKWW